MFELIASRWYGFISNSWINIIFPKLIQVKENGIFTKKHKSLFLFWMTEEENLSKSKIASVQHQKGLIWDKVLIETSGGTNFIEMKGLKKKDAETLVEKINNLAA